MSGLQGWMAALTDAGVTPQMPRTEARHVRVLNAVGILLSVHSFAYVPLFFHYLPATQALFLLNLPMIFAWASMPVLNRRGLQNAARYVALTTALLQVGGVAAISGRDSLIHYYFIGGIAFAFSIFPRNRPGGVLIYSGACTLAFFLIQFGVPVGWSAVPPEFLQWLRLSLWGGLVTFVYVVSIHNRREMFRADDEAAAAHQRSERLLLNILPGPIVERLKHEHTTIADDVPMATILFADIVGFTPYSQKVSPDALVQMLDGIFRDFDRLLERHGLEKIKTIGDAYMAASGVPLPCPDHAVRTARMALDMLALMNGPMQQKYPGLQLRIGLHSGPLVAGVIGKTRFAYDVWGDTVNTASRMESSSLPNHIGISRAVAELLGDGFVVEARGMHAVKGKGEMELYFLKAERVS